MARMHVQKQVAVLVRDRQVVEHVNGAAEPVHIDQTAGVGHVEYLGGGGLAGCLGLKRFQGRIVSDDPGRHFGLADGMEFGGQPEAAKNAFHGPAAHAQRWLFEPLLVADALIEVFHQII
jgi:hypothetical protein